ncbi:replicative DNA helicase [Rickettsiales bacterium (ex Bugula neritina AB1)]|nr:replicative DNA helicase [Rickettsiales bacterium (ex Bugula neritina AB1)]
MVNLYNLHLEQIILGTILNNNDVYGIILNKINKEAFYDLNHQIIFQEIINNLHRIGVADYIIIRDNVIKEKVKDEYLIEITKQNTHESNINEYVDMLNHLHKRRKAIIIGEALSKKAYKENFSIADIHEFEEEIFELLTNNQKNQTLSFEDSVNFTFKNLNKMLEEKRHMSGMTTGFPQLDNLLGGLQKGSLIVIAARTSMGKTAFATNIAVNTSMNKEYGGAVVIFSLEMPQEQITTRIISSLSDISVSDLLYARITEREVARCVSSMKKFSSTPLYIHDAADITIGEILTLLRNLKRKYQIKLVVIDYLQLINSGNDNFNENRVNEIGRITRRLKLIAKELNICVIVLSQLSRSPEKREDPTPKLSDLRESGNIEQDADVVLFVHRDKYYNNDKQDDSSKNLQEDNLQNAKIIVGKNRNGRLGIVNLIFTEEYTRFNNS